MRWGLQAEFPDLVTSAGGRYRYDDDWQTPDTQVISIDFPGKKSLTWESRSCNAMRIQGQGAAVTFYGEGGSMVIESGNAYTVFDNDRSPKEFIKVTAEDSKEAHDHQNTVGPGLMMDSAHIQNFLHAIREGSTPNSEIKGGHKSVLLCQLGNIAYRTKSTLHIDSSNGHIKDNPAAQKLWSREYAPGWQPQV